jgi:signal transduction histidine kinase
MSILHESSAASETEGRLELLLQASELLGRSLDFDVTFANLATLLVPRMADGYVVDLVETDATIRRLAAVDADPAKAPLMERLKRLGALNPKAPNGIQRLLEAGVPFFTERITDDGLVKGARDADHLAILRSLDLYSGLTVPLKSRGRSIGLLWLYFSRSKRVYTRDDLALAEEIAARAALAIDNARLFRELEETVKAREDFLAIASHELRTPVTALMLRAQGYARALARDPKLEPTREEVVRWLGSFNQQVARISRLIEEMLDVSRMTAGRLELLLEPLDLAQVAREAAANMEDDLRRKGCALTIDAEAGVTGLWDRTRMEQVVLNLLSNAMKYGEAKPISMRVRSAGEKAILEVRDQGIGIDAEHLTRIFERFERMVSSRNYGGFGLGLWIVRQIVEASGGTIRVSSAPGDGATFIVELPRKPEG